MEANRFSQIDSKLYNLAKDFGTIVDTSVGGHSFDGVNVPKDKLFTRKIFWKDDSIFKGIIISQNFDNRNIDTPDLDFIIIAWLNDGEVNSKGHPFWKKNLLTKAKFEDLEGKIDQLLKKSIDVLKTVKKRDLGFKQY